MDSFNNCLEDKNLLLVDDMDFPVNSIGRSNDYVKDFASRGVQTAERTGSVESIFLPHMIGEFLLGNPCMGVDNSYIDLPSTSVFSSDRFTQDLGFDSELNSNSYYHSSVKKVPLIISENPVDSKQGNSSRVSSEGSIVSSLLGDSLPAKADFHTQTIHCQVQGCYKDLSSSKVYHKRHKVCDLHSKSPKVVIKGIEKRFCQQCSRFHLLKEFDDIKRSCRKRLAGHNERRRRPQFGSQLGSHSGVLEMDLLDENESFLLIDEEHPPSFYYQEKNVDDNKRKHIKLEMVSSGKNELPMQLDYGSVPSLLSFKSKSVSNYLLPVNSEAINPVIGRILNKKSSQHLRPDTLNSTKNQENGMIYDGSLSDIKRYGLSRFSESASRSLESAGSTLDLLQLSSHLQRVGQQQNFVQVKDEN